MMALPAFINPTTISLALAAANTVKGMFGGKGDDIDRDEILKQLRSRFGRVGGAAQRQNEAILKQNLAGSSKAKSTSVLSQQLNRDIGSMFQNLSDAERHALGLLFRRKMQQDVFKEQQERDRLSNLTNLFSALGALKEGGVKGEGSGLTPEKLVELLSNMQMNPIQPKTNYVQPQNVDISGLLHGVNVPNLTR